MNAAVELEASPHRRRMFEAQYLALECWGEHYEVMHEGGFPSRSTEARALEPPGTSTPGHRILTPNGVPQLAWRTERRVMMMPKRMQRVLRMHYGGRLTHRQLATSIHQSERTVRRQVELTAAWLAGFEVAVRN